MAPRKRPRTAEVGESSNVEEDQPRPNLNQIYQQCFPTLAGFDHFRQYRNYPLKRERTVSIPFLDSEKFQFKYNHLLMRWNLMAFLSLNGIFYRNLVLIFYANAKCIYSPAPEKMVIAIESYLMGKRFRIDVDVIVNALGLEDEGISDENYFGHVLSGSVTALDVHDRFLHLMISWWIRPSNGKFSWIRQVDDFWIQCFRKAEEPNLPRIMFTDIVWHVQNRHTKHVKSFPYATALSAIFAHLEIDCSYDFPEPLKEPIDETSLHRANFHFIGGEWIRQEPMLQDQAPQDPNPIHEVPHAPQASNDALMAFLTEQFTSLNTSINDRFTGLEGQLGNLTTRVTSLEEQQLSMNMSIAAFHDEWRQSRERDVDDDNDDGEDSM